MFEIVLIFCVLIISVLSILYSYLHFKKEKNNTGELLTAVSEIEKSLGRFESVLKDEFYRNREETYKNSKEQREELGNVIKNFDDSVKSTLLNISGLQKNQLESFSNQLTILTQSNEEKIEKLTRSNEQKLGEVREVVENRLRNIQEDNNKQLEEMRHIVDEKLHATLEQRLGESFKQVSDRLEQVYKGLGEMQTLAAGVGDLKKVLTSVKSKGNLGEYQLDALLEQIMAPEQYGRNVKVKPNSSLVVEFALKLPGRDNHDKPVWLPIDSKFPTEDYQSLLLAYESGNIGLLEESKKLLSQKIKTFAKDIRDKYLEPPHTTDFGIMFLPFEGLYAEVLRLPGLFETIQREYKIIITGPTTTAAFLNALQIGFRTLAIQKRSSEVWDLLRVVKAEFGKFGDVLEKTKKKLMETTDEIDKASTRSRAIERKLRDVQQLPDQEHELLPDVETED